MRALDFLFQIVETFSPMNDNDRAELRRDANFDYIAVRDQVVDENKQPLKKDKLPLQMTIKQRIVWWSEQWPCRLVLALGFIAVVPFLQNLINPVLEDYDGEEEEE